MILASSYEIETKLVYSYKAMKDLLRIKRGKLGLFEQCGKNISP